MTEATFTPLPSSMDWSSDEFDGQEFYELMQAYRHAPITDQAAVVAAFEAVKAFARDVVPDSWSPY